MKKCYPLILFIALFLFTACSPIYVVRLEPGFEEASERMLYGNAVLEESIRDIKISISYYDASPEFLVFNLEVFNGSKSAFDFNPADVGIMSNIGERSQAIDPEFQLLTMDMNEARRRKNQRVMAWAGTALLVAGTVASVTGELSSSPSTTDAQIVGNASVDLGDILLTAAADANFRSLQHYSVPREEVPFPSSRYFWLDHSLRTTTIRPGERVVGKLVFPRMDTASSFTVFVPIPTGEASFTFDQRVFRP